MTWRVRVATLVCLLMMVSASPSSASTEIWHPLSAPSAVGRGYGEPTCLNARMCWVPYSTQRTAGIVYTVDGGHRWLTSRVAAKVNVISGISCSSITTCAAVGFLAGAQGIPRAVALHTSDGGRDWNLATLPPTYIPESGSWTRLDTVSCRSTGECVALGAGPGAPAQPVNCGTGCTYTPGPTGGTIALWALTSSDGGGTWSGSIVENSMPDEAYEVTCPNATTCVGVGFGFHSCPPGQKCGASGLAFHYDASSTTPWSLVSVPTGIFSVNSLSCPSATLCLAVGSTGDAETGHGVVLRSLNGGVSWQRLQAPPGSNSIVSISCVNARVCVAAGGLGTSSYVRPTMFLTSNGGATWHDEFVSSVEFTGEVACPNVKFCVMTGGLSLSPAHGLILGGYA